MKEKLSFLQIISVLLSYIITLMNLQGVMGFGTTGLLLFGFWLIITILSFNEELHGILHERWFLCIIPFLVYYLITSAISESVSVGVNRCVAFLSTASPVMMYEILKNRDSRFKKFFLLSIAIIFIINVVLSYSFLDIIGEDSLRQNQEYGSEFYVLNIVFNMCYAFAILIPCLVDIFRSTKGMKSSWVKRYLLLFAAVAMLAFLIRAQFMTAILLAIFGSVFAWFYKSGSKSLITVSIVFVILGYLFVQLYPTFRSSSQLDEFSDVTHRLDEIYATMTGNKHNAVDMNSRQDLSWMSMETFFKHPVFGMNPRMIHGVHPNQQGIGNHASWPDFLALYGLFAIFIFVFLWNALKQQRLEIDKITPAVVYVALGFLNPLWYFPQMVSVFLIAPLMYDLINDNLPKNAINSDMI